MKRLILLFLLAFGTAMAQHGESHEKSGEAAQSHGGGHGSLDAWKWANFALLAGALGWLIKKNAGPWFSARSREIRKQMVEAEELQAQAERKTRDIEARLANVQAEIETMRSEAHAEAVAEAERVRQATGAELKKIQQTARQEIDAAGKQARLELKRYAADIALALAETRVRAGMTPAAQDALVRSFVQNLDGPS
ncbi:MAG: hypothetical protein ACE15B_10195 [Bryobacteraceae bacterium]